MYRVELVATLAGDRRLTDDGITDLIESVADELDQHSVEPSVGTQRAGDDVEMTVSVSLDNLEEWDALARGLSAVKAAFDSAGIRSAGPVQPRDLRSHVSHLRAA